MEDNKIILFVDADGDRLFSEELVEPTQCGTHGFLSRGFAYSPNFGLECSHVNVATCSIEETCKHQHLLAGKSRIRRPFVPESIR